MENQQQPIIIEHFYNVSKEKLWEAITNPKEMQEWYFNNIPDFKTEIGFTTQFNIKSHTRDFNHIWTVTNVVLQNKITYTWVFEGITGKSSTCFEISGNQNQSILKLTATVLEPFPSNIPEFERESGIDGWNYFIKKQLDSYLNS
ncbi:uncharacterized protein YndB with AHSA1/START domain [Lacinutrix venerupis]|uniref:SRPBCC family protein n=1 Tax=Lacinutrix venerupis TaxID=1486034 RepID=UPI000EB55C0B|nr:SRPBCC domain-containing protein [Lacinutrix venerupis]RLJ64507.1 uncharacterized protein YndB with AHSA1/START domain [Lacinutrix venerupis]